MALSVLAALSKAALTRTHVWILVDKRVHALLPPPLSLSLSLSLSLPPFLHIHLHNALQYMDALCRP